MLLLTGGNNNPKGQSREEKTNIAWPWQYCVHFRSFSTLIPQLLWRMTSVRLLGWTGGQLFRLHYSLDFCSCFQGFHPLRPSGTSLIVCPRTKWMASVCPSFSLSSSNICFFLPKVLTAPEHGFVGGKDFGVCALLLSTQLKDRLLMW